MSSFININNKEEIIEAKYSANVIRKALLISETKSSIKADKLTKNIDAPISLNEALVLFSDKLNAMRHLTKLSLVESEEVSQELNNNISELELNEGAMSEIHRLAQEAKDVVDFTKKFFKEFGDKIKKSTESTEWVQGLYNDVVSESKLEEGKSIGKIQKEYGQVVKDMITTVEEWKTAEGDRKKELLEKLRSLTAQKKQLSSDLDDAVGIKDLNVELAEDHSENPNDKYEVRPCDKPETPYGVWEGDVLVKCFETEEEADIYAKEQNKEQGLDESVITEAKFKKGQYIKAKNDSDNFDGDVYDKTNDVDGSEILKNSSFEIYEIGKDEVVLWSDADQVEYSIDPDDLKNFVKESVVTESKLTWDSLKESLGINEGRSINKISKEHSTVVLDMKATVDEWKVAEGDRKSELLETLRGLNARKAELEKELDQAVAGKDSGVELALSESEVNEKDDAGTHLDNLADLVGNAKSFMNVGKELKAGNYKYDFSTGMMPMYMIQADGFKFAILNKKYVDGGDREVGDIAIGLMESLNEQADDALILIQQALKGMKNMKASIKGDNVIISNKAKDEFVYSLNDGGDVKDFIATIEESINLDKKKVESLDESLRNDLKKFIKRNQEELDRLADGEQWEQLYLFLYTEMDVEPESPEAEEVKAAFDLTY